MSSERAKFQEESLLRWGGEGDDEALLSDWKIIVTTTKGQGRKQQKAETKTTTYTVHKSVLGLGQRKSKYFLRLFQTKNVKEAQTSTSQLELEASIAKGIPYHVGFHV